MIYRTMLPALAILLAGAVPLSAQTAQTQGTQQRDTTAKAAARDTTISYVIRDKEGVQIMLQPGYTYAAVMDGQELALEVKPVAGNLREAVVEDVSLAGSMEMVKRFTVRVEDSGLYEFRVTGLLPGRDIVMRLTGPSPVRPAPAKP